MASNPLVPPQKNPLIPPNLQLDRMANQLIPPSAPSSPSPSLGFQTWASSPLNSFKVQSAMIAPGAPLQPNAGNMAAVNPPQTMASSAPPRMPSVTGGDSAILPPHQRTSAQPSTAPVSYAANPPGSTPMASSMPPGGLPQLPGPVTPPAQSQLQADTAKLQQLQTQGAGLNKIENPWLRILAKVGDTAGTILAPGVAAAIPGTTVHNWQLQKLKQGDVAQDQQNATAAQQQAQSQASLLDTQAQTLQRTAIGDKATAQAGAIPEQLKQKRDATLAQLAKNGQVGTYDADGNLTITDDPNSQAYQQRESLMTLQQARAEMASAQADLAKSRNNPNSPLFKQAQARLQTAQQNAQTAVQRLGLSRDVFNMHAYNSGPDGQTLPGAMIGDDGTPVGTANASNVRPTATQRDAAGRADVADSLRTGILQQLQDPEVRGAFGPVQGRITEAQIKLGTASPKVAKAYNDLVSYGAFQAGMHPVRGIGALQYFDKVNGGLGQSPEELEGKLASGKGVMGDVTAVGTPNVKGARQQPSIPARNPMQAPGTTPPSGKAVSLAQARQLPANKGKTDAAIRKDIQAHGHQVIE